MTKEKRSTRSKRSKLARREAASAWVFLAPALILMTLFIFYPMISAGYISLHSWDLLTEMEFIGIENYKALFSDSDWWETIGRTFLYVLCYVPALFVCSLGMALLVKALPKGSGLFRTLYFMPIILSSVVTGLIWKLMYDEKTGVINDIAETLFGVRIPWLSSTEWSMPAVLIVAVWMQMGYYMVIFLAGLQDIPKDYYEAASIDGAGKISQFFNITLPSLKNTIVFVLVTTLIGSFQAYDTIAIITKGGPAGSTTLAVQDIYESAFLLYDMGYAASKAINLFVIILAFSLIQFKLMKSDNN